MHKIALECYFFVYPITSLILTRFCQMLIDRVLESNLTLNVPERGFVFSTVKCSRASHKEVPRSQIKVIMTFYWLSYVILMFVTAQQEMLSTCF